MNFVKPIYGLLTSRIAARLIAYVEQHDLGLVTIGTQVMSGANRDRVDTPSIGFTAKERLMELDLENGFFPASPDIAIEVGIDEAPAGHVPMKVINYIAAGTQQVWFVFAPIRRISVYDNQKHYRSYDRTATISAGNAIPGFSLSLSEVFAGLPATAPKPKKDC
jgi:Uma2 family endonuclease